MMEWFCDFQKYYVIFLKSAYSKAPLHMYTENAASVTLG